MEDNAVNQLVAMRLLEKRGHTVVVAANGREALAILEESEWVGFDCVLMDVQMPEMDWLGVHGRYSHLGTGDSAAPPRRCNDGSCHERG